MQILYGSEYPETIRISGNKKYISNYKNNRIIAGIRNIWASFKINYCTYSNQGNLWNIIKQFFHKDEKATWKQWVHFTWLELKDFALEISNLQETVPHDVIWLLQVAPNKQEVYCEEDFEESSTNFVEIDGNIVINDPNSPFNEVKLKEYKWNEEKQRYMAIPERTPKNMIDSYKDMMMSISSYF